MSDTDDLIGLARDLAEEVVDIASELLSAGIGIKRVQSRYVAVAVELLADAEAQGLRAAIGDSYALVELGRIATALAALRNEARADLEASGGSRP
jgi:hypothetical protein